MTPEESVVRDNNGNPVGIRVTSNDGRTSVLHEYKDDLISRLTESHKGAPIEVAEHHKDGTTDSYKYNNSLMAVLTGDNRGEKKNK